MTGYFILGPGILIRVRGWLEVSQGRRSVRCCSVFVSSFVGVCIVI